ncbi:MAG: bifunctional non-ous end joining protein LigD [Solirubrobacteraceae bacterium]|jgi:bifunctional non-homologous end joining protein LigD|nr:bifunctional non-ous end joining protein LigD [Solirubrobacteraceae bacterium]
MTSALETLAAPERELLRPAPPPSGSSAMKATLTREPFSDPNWIFERKLDGIRCVAIRSGDAVRLLSRNDLPLNGRYPELAAALSTQPCESFAVDGEIVAFDGSATSFARLAQRRQRFVPVFFYVFDLLWLEGSDVRTLGLRSRKRLLREVLTFADPVRWTQHRNGAGEALFEQACRKAWEGLIAKRADSPYSDRRSRDWLKLKCEQGQELVIGGYTKPRGSRTEFGALLLGYYESGALRYAGKVGTGFDQATLAELGEAMRGLRVGRSPFAGAADIRERDVTWVEPVLVAQVGFTEWTGHGRLRHPRFLGLRDDKAAAEVVRER